MIEYMLLESIIPYIAGTVTKTAKNIVSKATDKLTKNITNSSSGDSPSMPEAVAKSVGATNPVTGKPMGGSNNYKPAPAYAQRKSAYSAGVPSGTYAVLFAPFILGLAAMSYIMITSGVTAGAESLAPGGISPLLIGLIIFSVLYLIFIILFFAGRREELKEVKKPRPQKSKS